MKRFEESVNEYYEDYRKENGYSFNFDRLYDSLEIAKVLFENNPENKNLFGNAVDILKGQIQEKHKNIFGGDDKNSR